MKGKVFSITTLMLLATSISTSAFYPTLSGHKSGNLLSTELKQLRIKMHLVVQ